MPAQSQNPFPLDIGTKEDSWDKLQLLQYLDPSLKITAAELNKIVRALEFLYGNITTGGYMGNVPATFRRANIDFNDPIGTPITKVRDFINGMPNHVIPNGYEQWFFTYRAVLTNDQGLSTPGGRHFAIIAEYYLLTKKIPPVNGVASIGTGGTQITTADLMKLYERDSRSAEPVEYDLGNIGTSEIWDAADGSGPRSTPNAVTTLFRAIQGGTEKIWLYIGAQEEVGTGYPVTDANDYREISSDGSGMDPEPPSSDFRILPYEFIIDEMLTDQARQNTNQIIFVEKAHEDPSLNFPQGETRTYAYYQLRSNSTKTGSLSDYRLVAAPYGKIGKNLQRKVTTSGSLLTTDNKHTLIFDGTDLTLTLDKNYPDNFEAYLYNNGTTAVTFIGTMFSGWTLSQDSMTLYPKETCAIIADGASKNLMIIGNE